MTGLTINAHPMASVLVARTDLTDDQAYALAEMSERVRAQISTVYPLARTTAPADTAGGSHVACASRRAALHRPKRTRPAVALCRSAGTGDFRTD